MALSLWKNTFYSLSMHLKTVINCAHDKFSVILRGQSWAIRKIRIVIAWVNKITGRIKNRRTDSKSTYRRDFHKAVLTHGLSQQRMGLLPETARWCRLPPWRELWRLPPVPPEMRYGEQCSPSALKKPNRKGYQFPNFVEIKMYRYFPFCWLFQEVRTCPSIMIAASLWERSFLTIQTLTIPWCPLLSVTSLVSVPDMAGLGSHRHSQMLWGLSCPLYMRRMKCEFFLDLKFYSYNLWFKGNP